MLANISFDIDGLWSALKFHNIDSDPKEDYILEQGIPKILNLLKKYELKTDFFVVGKNVENYKDLHLRIKEEQIAGNHTYNHPHNLGKLNINEIKEEVVKGHDTIIKHLKIKPRSFRAPTYGVNANLLKVLKDLNYEYDSSIMPAYYPGITPLRNLLLKKKPHMSGGVFEVPLSVNPLIPIYVNGTTIIALGLKWLKFSMKVLNKFNLPLIINFHARDGVDIPRVLKKQFKRGNKNSFEIMEKAIGYVKKNAEIVSLQELKERY